MSGKVTVGIEYERANGSAIGQRADPMVGTSDTQPAEQQPEIKQTQSRSGRHAEQPDLLCYPSTDTGNAERLVAMFRDSIRYCPDWKTWLIWDGERWNPDHSGEIWRCAKKVVRTFYAQVTEIRAANDRTTAETHARRSESAAAIRAMLACAESEAGIAVFVTELDCDPWLLNCRTGTIDLRTGLLREHRKEDLITKLCPVDFSVNAKCPRFLKFLTRILGGSADLPNYVQRVFGYTLTGVVSEKACFCLLGEGNNGKTTLLELFRYILGDYATQVMIDTLMTKRSHESNASLADLADLRGARLVTTSETEEGQKLAEGKLKYLTGMGEIKTCRKYENFFTFSPTHKILIDANHRPTVRGTDTAIWIRLKPIPFTITIPKDEIDRDLLEKLKGEAPGVLAWAVEGCLAWQQQGLAEPQEILDSVGTWKSEDDPYKEFFENECEFDPESSTPVREVWLRFREWAGDNAIRCPSRRKLYERLRLQDCAQTVSRPGDAGVDHRASLDPDKAKDPGLAAGRQVRCWKGIKLI
jgi:putative DNA primase/helicase